MYFDEKVTRLVQISSPRVFSKTCSIDCFLSPLLHEQIQICKRYSILQNFFSATASNWTIKLQTENRIHAKKSTLRLKILWPTNHSLVTRSKTKKNINIIQNSREKDRTRKVNRFYFKKFQKAKIETFFLLFPNSWSLSRLSFLCYGSCTHACNIFIPQVLSKNQKEINTVPGNIRSVMARLPLRLNITTIMRWWKLQEARKIW